MGKSVFGSFMRCRQRTPKVEHEPERKLLGQRSNENFFGLLKSELLYLQDFDSMEHFKVELIDYLDYYNNRRIKAKLKGMTPAQHRYQTLQIA